MRVEVRKASIAEKNIIANLMKLYQYDFTDFGGEPVGERGEFIYKYFESYWGEKEHYPFLIYFEDEIAGFSFVNRNSLLGNKDVYTVAEFFILRYLRAKGIGFDAARKIINKFPGTWEISQTYKNIGAQEFWFKVASSLAKGKIEKIKLEADQKIVLKFEI